MIGKAVWFTGKIGVYDGKIDKICIENVHSVEGFERDHCWVKHSKRLNLKRGTKISFKALLCEYVGLDGDKQVKKIGLMTVRNVKEI